MDNNLGAAHSETMREVTTSEARREQMLDRTVAFKWPAAIGALSAAIAPAVMATADGEVLRGSVSAYWDIDPRYLFWLPFTIAAVLLFVDGALSYSSPNRNEFGGRWYNLVLGISLLGLTWFNKDNNPELHFPAAAIFFTLFIAVIAYTSFLGWTGRRIESDVTDGEDDDDDDRLVAQTSLVFLLLLVLTLAAWLVGFVTFFFFEIFALVNFALYYVQGSLRAFPYVHYEFRISWLNTFFRATKVMRS